MKIHRFSSSFHTTKWKSNAKAATHQNAICKNYFDQNGNYNNNHAKKSEPSQADPSRAEPTKYSNNKLSNVSNYVSNESFSKRKCNFVECVYSIAPALALAKAMLSVAAAAAAADVAQQKICFTQISLMMNFFHHIRIFHLLQTPVNFYQILHCRQSTFLSICINLSLNIVQRTPIQFDFRRNFAAQVQCISNSFFSLTFWFIMWFICVCFSGQNSILRLANDFYTRFDARFCAIIMTFVPKNRSSSGDLSDESTIDVWICLSCFQTSSFANH